jgi:hypothetical protein
VLPLGALALAARRERRAREILRLAAPPRARRVPRLLALAAVPALLGVAATQPALRSRTTLRIRTDAQVFYVIDTSRSMLAASGPTATTRLARAKADAIAMRNALPQFPSGVATFTDRILPDLLPDDDPAVFDSTVEHAVAIEEPPPSMQSVVATTLGALTEVGTQNFFPPAVKKRLVVLLTDGESAPFDAPQVAHALASGPGIKLILVHVWARNETVYDQGRPESAYHEDDASGEMLASLASTTGGHVYGEHAIASAIATAKADLGRGPSVVQGQTEQTRSLATYVALVALLPLLFVVWPGSWGMVIRLTSSGRRPATGDELAAGAPRDSPAEEGSILPSR